MSNTKEKQEQLSCCSAKPKKEPKTALQGLLYGLIPHIGCIAFIIGSILGVTVLTSFFRPLLMNKNFFYILLLVSLLFATLASVLYLRKLGLLSSEGMRKKWKYLLTMYGSTVAINLLLFMIIFPLLANVSAASALPSASQSIGGAGSAASTSTNVEASILKLKVNIPCPGHAPLITNELKTIDGVLGVKFSFPNNFEVVYDSAKTNKQAILSLSVFQEYKATVESELNNVASQQNSLQDNNQISTTGTIEATEVTAGCGCGGGSGSCGGCGGSTGGCGGGSGAGTCGARY